MTERLEGREFAMEAACDLDFLWQALTTVDGLSSWYVVDATVDPRPGGSLSADWGTGPSLMGTYADVEPGRRLRLVYPDEAGPGTEEWLLEHDRGVTRVRLIHSLPVEDGATWDDTYPGIVQGWGLFFGTLEFVAERVGRLGRSTAVRVGDVAVGAWPRVLAALGLRSTPPPGTMFDLADRKAEVLVSLDGLSVLVALDDEATLLVDVEGSKLYTVAATYGEDSPQSAELRRRITAIAELACAAASLPGA